MHVLQCWAAKLNAEVVRKSRTWLEMITIKEAWKSYNKGYSDRVQEKMARCAMYDHRSPIKKRGS